ncbi:uroporphyrinogen-III C-methyltransferase [Tepidibacter thalassicus]|uniref:uroporphyrinogen-III C-methyltransferase n=1 Tax=Tepidibacter thalassicus DSM 15285 TaxID=1123350 RepID=A0A1M5TQH7_9FIRM|nr:uroporphyrinogen-III C-methyltransferase [Tepidibacter thalassicus]SHH53027.1 uroporphyrinogen III methyltransferase / synthase [Tepidibacter thalassicus DSM 15285]
MKGKVYLVGAGPGDYKLITLKALECIKEANVIVYDRLVNEKLLNEAKESCEFIYVGKSSSNHTLTQDEINEVIANKAKEGKVVTRLKGGDPYVFGRGGEEGEYLLERNIEFEVVPGITSAIGGLCYAGIPITHRNYASSFHVITGHLKDEEKELNWKVLAQFDGTLVFLMGVKNLENICTNLIKEGKDKKTPVAIINWATRYNQRVVTGNLENIYEIALKENIKPPSLIVVGDVVNLRDKLNFFENKPLFGKSIMVTRARSQNSKLVEKIMDLGGNPIEFPTIKIEEISPNKELEEAIKNIEKYSYIVFTSQNGVKIFFNKLVDLSLDFRKLNNIKIVAIGPATANALKDRGIIADIVPKEYIAESIFDELKDKLISKDNILIPRASKARDYLIEKLSEICYVKEIKIYDTVLGDVNKEEILDLLESNKIDYITFTSSSTVKNLVKIIGEKNLEKLKNAKLISIGPITSNTIKSFDLDVYKEAKEYTINGILDIISKDIRGE